MAARRSARHHPMHGPGLRRPPDPAAASGPGRLGAPARAAGSSSTCWKAWFTRSALATCGMVYWPRKLSYVSAGTCWSWRIALNSAPARFMISSSLGSPDSSFVTPAFSAQATIRSPSSRCCAQSMKYGMPTTRTTSSMYVSQSVSKAVAKSIRVPLSKITNRTSRRPVRMFTSGGRLRTCSMNRWIAARSSSSWPGLTVQKVLSSETTPETLPLPDFVVTWPFVVAACVAMVVVSSSLLAARACLRPPRPGRPCRAATARRARVVGRKGDCDGCGVVAPAPGLRFRSPALTMPERRRMRTV